MLGTTDVLDQLREDGFRVSAGYLRFLFRERILAPPLQRVGGVFAWDETDAERLRSLLLRRGRGPGGIPIGQSVAGAGPSSVGAGAPRHGQRREADAS